MITTLSNLQEAAATGNNNSIHYILDEISKTLYYACMVALDSDQLHAASLLGKNIKAMENYTTMHDEHSEVAMTSEEHTRTALLSIPFLFDSLILIPYLFDSRISRKKKEADIIREIECKIYDAISFPLKHAAESNKRDWLKYNLSQLCKAVDRCLENLDLLPCNLNRLRSALEWPHKLRERCSTESLECIRFDVSIPGLRFAVEEKCLKSITNIDAETVSGIHMAYICAAESGHIECMRSIDNRFVINDLMIIDGFAAIPSAISGKHSGVIRFLLHRHDWQTLWFWAAKSDFPDVLSTLLNEEFYPIVSKEEISARIRLTCQENGQARSALQYAVLANASYSVQFLLERDEIEPRDVFAAFAVAVDNETRHEIVEILSRRCGMELNALEEEKRRKEKVGNGW